MNFDFDVIIVGTGVAGALCAYKLSQQGDGARILMIDPGVNDLDDKQRMSYRTTFALTANRSAGQIPTYMDLARDRFAPSVDGIDLTRYLVQSQPPTPNPENRSLYKVPYQRLIGGSTWTWRGNCPRFIPSDFELKHATPSPTIGPSNTTSSNPGTAMPRANLASLAATQNGATVRTG